MADGRSVAKLVGTVVACEAAGGIGAFLSRQGLQEWYPTLRKPSFTPPGSYFGPTWTLLYALMGASLWLAGERGEDGAAKRASRALFGAQLLLKCAVDVRVLRSPGARVGVRGGGFSPRRHSRHRGVFLEGL